MKPSRGVGELDELLLGASRTYTREQVAEQAGAPLEQARRFWRALGFADSGRSVAFTDADVAALRRVAHLVEAGVVSDDLAIGLTRALGHTTARLASWQVDVVVEMLSGGTGLRSGVSVTEAYRVAELLLPELEPLLVHAWRRQLSAAVDRVLQEDETLVDAAFVTVGFADLVGFTRLSRRLEERDLGAVVERFEQVSADVITTAGARMVKTLGDEVLFVGDTPGAAAGAALSLLEVFALDEDVPELRVGLATGLVIGRMGDVFGTTVNLASRLTDLARPGTALIDAATAEDLEGDTRFVTQAVRRRALRGLGVIEPHRLRRGPDGVVHRPDDWTT